MPAFTPVPAAPSLFAPAPLLGSFHSVDYYENQQDDSENREEQRQVFIRYADVGQRSALLRSLEGDQVLF